jgi:hypothetical protein
MGNTFKCIVGQPWIAKNENAVDATRGSGDTDERADSVLAPNDCNTDTKSKTMSTKSDSKETGDRNEATRVMTIRVARSTWAELGHIQHDLGFGSKASMLRVWVMERLREERRVQRWKD